jgi:hypothetical protein
VRAESEEYRPLGVESGECSAVGAKEDSPALQGRVGLQRLRSKSDYEG